MHDFNNENLLLLLLFFLYGIWKLDGRKVVVHLKNSKTGLRVHTYLKASVEWKADLGTLKPVKCLNVV